jgi:O-antigen ligase
MTISRANYFGVAIGVLAGLAALVESRVSSVVAAVIPAVLIAGLWVLSGPRRWIAAFCVAAVLLPPLPIELGDSGPHPALAVALIGLVAGVVYSGAWRFRLTLLTASLLVLSTAIICSAALASFYAGPLIAAASLMRAALFMIGIYVFFFRAYGPGSEGYTRAFSEVRLLFWVGCLAAAFACIDFYFQFPAPARFSPQFIWLDSGVFRRAQGLFYEASTLGNFCAFFLTMIAVAVFRPPAERPLGIGFMLIGGILLVTALVLSYSRGSVLNLVFSLAALCVLQRKRGSLWRTLLVIASSVASAGLAIYLFAPDLFRAYGFRLQNSVLNSTSSTNGVLSGRLDAWHSILNFLGANPWHLVLGVGYKTLPYSDYVGHTVIPDNAFLSALAETGVVGFTALVVLLFAILRSSYQAARDPDSSRSFLGAWSFCFWCGQTVQMLSGDLLTYWRVLPVYFWILALTENENSLS